MNKKPLVALSVIGLIALVLSTGSVVAQDPPPTANPQSPAVAAEVLNPQSPQQPAAPIGTAMSYQGQLQKSGGAYNGTCNFQFSLWDAATGGAQIGSMLTKPNVAITNGLFGVELDFGNQFTGEARWLQTAVQCTGDVEFTTLAPRQPMNATPYAMSLRPGGAVVASYLAMTSGNKRLDIQTGGAIDIQSATDDLYIHSRRSGYGCTENCTGNTYLQPFGGNVGVGTNNPADKLHVNGGAIMMTNDGKQFQITTGAAVDLMSTTSHLYIHSRQSGPGCTSNCLGNTYLQPFGGRVGIGTDFPETTLDVNGTSRSKIVQITGGSDLAERFEQADSTNADPGTVMVADENNPGKLKVGISAYDTKVVGIVSGAGGINTGLTLHQEGAMTGDLVVAVAGRVYAKCEATSSPIKPGDLLTTSSIPGHCMKATDRDRRDGAVIGKAMSGLKEGKGLVLVIVNLQ